MKLRYLTLFALAVMLGLAARPVFAHGFGERYDLPLPLGFFAVGGAAAVVLSFVLIGLFVRGERREFSYPRFNLRRFSPHQGPFGVPFLVGWDGFLAHVQSLVVPSCFPSRSFRCSFSF